MTEQEQFEKWAKQPPREWNVSKFAADSDSWPNQYCDYKVTCSWEGWQARGLSTKEGCIEADAVKLRKANHELIGEVDRLKALLTEAATDLQDWGGYASEYLQEKHNLKADIEKYREIGK